MTQSPARLACVVCQGTGLKPCGQCGGAGTNQEDLFGGRFRAGDACWLCEARSIRAHLLRASAEATAVAGRKEHDVRRLRRHDRLVLICEALQFTAAWVVAFLEPLVHASGILGKR